MRVVSLPSEKVPAPPSPNWALALGSSTASFHRPATARTRSAMGAPRSSTMGSMP